MLSAILFFIFVSKVASKKLHIRKIIAFSLVIGGIAFLQAMAGPDSVYYFLLSALGGGITLVFAVLLCPGELWKRFVIPIFFFLIRIVAEGIAYRVYALYIFGGMLTFFTYGLLGLTGIYIWKIIDDKKTYSHLAFFFILPGCFFAVLYTFVSDLGSTQRWLGLVLTFIGNSVLLLYVLWIAHRETRNIARLEHAYAQEVNNRRENFIMIRHDFNNQLATIGRLIRNGEDSSSQNMIEALSKEIQQTNENPYSNIPVVNAIITEKARVCAQWGIGFNVELDMPERLSVENIHLCSIFGNLLDNAINACKQTDPATQPAIRLQAMVDGDYLFIKLTNPSNKPPKKKAFGRGYGSRILSDLAARYQGEYSGEYENGLYTASVLLLALDGEEKG